MASGETPGSASPGGGDSPAAAVVGRLHSLPLTFLGAMILGIGNSMVVGYGPANYVSQIQAALPMVLLFVVLLLIPEVRLTIGRVVRVRSPGVASARTTLVGGGVVLVGVVVLTAGHEPSDELAEDIKGYVREHLSAYAYPRRIEFVADLPKTLTGKIRRIELRQREFEQNG